MQAIKSRLKKNPIVRKVYSFFFRSKNNFSTQHWVSNYIPNESITVVQIGANDGISGDPLYQLAKENKAWNILFVEPVPSIFELLKNNYPKEDRFKFENAGINADGENQFFYTVSETAYTAIPDLSELYRQIGSFDKNHITKLSEGKLTNYIQANEVNCLTLEQLFSKNDIHSLDLLFIDAEGYDWKIISQLDLDKFKPRIIYLEYCNLEQEEYDACVSFLSSKYYVFALRINFLCIRRDIIKEKDLKILKAKLQSPK